MRPTRTPASIAAAASLAVLVAACSGSTSSQVSAVPSTAAPTAVGAAASALPSASAASMRSSASPKPVPTGTAVITGIDSPVQLAFVGDSVWVTEHMVNKVGEFAADGSKRHEVDVSSSVATDTGPGSIVELGGKLFVTNQNAFGLTRIDPTTAAVETTSTERKHGPCALATSAAGSIWFLACDEGVVVRMDPSLKTVATIPLGTSDGLDGLLFADGRVWGSAAGKLFSIDPKTNELTRYDVGGVPKASGDGSLWLIDGPGKHVVRVDPKTGAATASLEMPASADDLAFGGGAAWVVSAFPIQDRSVLYKVDPSTNAVAGSVGVIGQPPGNPVFRDGAIWMTEFDARQVVSVPAF